MGYESKLYLCDGSDLHPKSGNGKTWAQVIAIVDLCVCGRESETAELIQASHESKWFVYSDDGDTPILEDPYGDPLKAVDADLLIEAMDRDNRKEYYRRFELALAMLKVCRERFGERFIVLHFGH